MKKLILILFAVAGCFGKITAQEISAAEPKSGWIKITEKTIDSKRNRDEINITNDSRFIALKVISKDADMNMYGIELYYEGGNAEVIGLNKPLKAGKLSESYDLDKSQRDLKQLAFTYKAIPASKKTHIEVWGFKTQDELIKQ